ncbi:DUF4397 domain-containing protein [Enterocloster lavalensis]|uniref:DUF4397 domain-containing protein n=1 Tax=Enterocloster lavalensis TaxID=460384 RepID=UPI002664F753|nr:DUF4397 domain-containing protein [Enterocloster lavalensis]
MNEYDTIPLYTAQARDEVIDPDFTSPDYGMAVPPYEEPVDPDFSVMPDTGVPCVFCNNHQWVHGAVRLLNAAAVYNPFTVLIDNQLAYTGLESPEITEYRQIPQGYHIFSVIDANQNTYFQKSMYVGDGMATIAIVNSAGGLNLLSIADTACPTTNTTSCFRVCNLAYYSGPINASLGNIYFNSINFSQVTSFSPMASGSYTLRVARSARPETALITTSVNLNPRRIYTLYVLNWNPSLDTIRTLLVEDRRN